jgi:tetratricopeptide (TPR) repeat protein
MARNNLASALAALGRLDEAEAEDRRALAMYQRLLEPGSPGIAAAQFYLADVLLARGKVAEALPLAEAAWRRRQQDDIAPEFRAETAFLLTRVLWAHDASPTSRIRAHALGEQALSGFEQVADAHGVRAKEVKDWLDQHPVPTAR